MRDTPLCLLFVAFAPFAWFEPYHGGCHHSSHHFSGVRKADGAANPRRNDGWGHNWNSKDYYLYYLLNAEDAYWQCFTYVQLCPSPLSSPF